ncbi:sigma-54-dependent Fis family transcriptional regulator [Marinobacter sp.]|uniref:sigma-54-dependent Fis family transcriptional regulator n=1 Tax=Marinobacter sp. TaxID=50741 RepID=UPI002B49A7D3|nr:sigma 54-interacting transcriptional regulator [Marinobacter sp.]HKK55605.1 sigma 54-interacting transcriptional regulator [Marinobacter sp.]
MSRYSRELTVLRDQHAGLIAATAREIAPYFHNMLQKVQCVVVLADREGTILQAWHPDEQPTANVEAVQPGNTLSETQAGTAIPIFDARGLQSGVLCLQSTTRMSGDYSLGMVKLMSHGIENRLLFEAYQGKAHILKFNSSPSSLDSNWAGLLVIDFNGVVRATNRRARTMLGQNVLNVPVQQIFDVTPETLTSVAARQPARLKANGNHQIFAQLSASRAPAQVSTQNKDDSADHRQSADAFEAEQDGTIAAAIPEGLIPEDVVAPENLEHGDTRVRRLVGQARKIMEKDIPILVFGETGSGKEILVRSLHYHSSRSSGPLIAVNCAAIPSELAESQLFGYEKGAFTGAHNKGYIGLIRQADGGTLFLDEIGEMPLMLQSRLLRVLQQRIVTPLGSTESYPVNIKLISATNRSLGEDIRRGYFRQDLYYRIAGLNVELPSLRERTDIEPLIRFVHQRLLRAEPGPPLSGAMLDLLARHPWPGNMRQLVHALQVGMAMADGAILEETHLPDAFFADAIEPAGIQTEPLSELVPRLYHANGRNISRTARAAGVSRNTVYKYLRTPAAG